MGFLAQVGEVEGLSDCLSEGVEVGLNVGVPLGEKEGLCVGM